MLERILRPRVLGQRALEARLGTREIAPRGEEERSAAGRDRQRPGAVERAGALLPRYELPLGLLELADRDQRLERVGQLQAMPRLEHADAVADLPCALEVAERGRRIAARELDEAEHPAMARLRDANAVRLRERERALRPLASILDSTLVRRDHRGGQLRDRLLPLAAELRPERERVGRMAGRQLPVPGPPLEDAQQPERVGLLGVVPRVQRFAPVLEEWAGALELTRPDELEARNDVAAPVSGHSRQRPLERERLLHLLARDASPAAEVQEPERRQRPAPERGVAGS